ncbi:MAG: ankyrin repeat domain-containing protein [Rickettsiales bacterium]|nr:ankyrin repeat domain-containing protein [Rickettsiales bacterium]
MKKDKTKLNELLYEALLKFFDEAYRGLEFPVLDINYIRDLLKQGADPDIQIYPPLEDTPLTIIPGIRKFDQELVELASVFLEYGADINKEDSRRRTALTRACALNKPYLISLFLSREEVEVDLQDKNYKTALMYCAESGDPETVLALVNKGADINKANTFDTPHGRAYLTAFAFALQNNKTENALILLKNGAFVEYASPNRYLILACSSGENQTINAVITYATSSKSCILPTDGWLRSWDSILLQINDPRVQNSLTKDTVIFLAAILSNKSSILLDGTETKESLKSQLINRFSAPDRNQFFLTEQDLAKINQLSNLNKILLKVLMPQSIENLSEENLGTIEYLKKILLKDIMSQDPEYLSEFLMSLGLENLSEENLEITEDYYNDPVSIFDRLCTIEDFANIRAQVNCMIALYDTLCEPNLKNLANLNLNRQTATFLAVIFSGTDHNRFGQIMIENFNIQNPDNPITQEDLEYLENSCLKELSSLKEGLSKAICGIYEFDSEKTTLSEISLIPALKQFFNIIGKAICKLEENKLENEEKKEGSNISENLVPSPIPRKPFSVSNETEIKAKIDQGKS